MGNTNSQLLDNITKSSNFDQDEVERLRKRFLKLDRVGRRQSIPLRLR